MPVNDGVQLQPPSNCHPVDLPLLENLEPMTPLFLLSLVRKVGFSIDFIYDLGVSRPEVTRIMTDPLLRHREDKMLGVSSYRI